MQGCTKCILLLILSFSFLFVYLFYNTDIFKLTMTKTINKINDKIFRGNRKSSNEIELNNKRRHTSDGKEHMLNNIAKVKNYVTLSKSEPSQVKVLLLAYGRTGSSLTGDLISADTSSAYFFEPFWYVHRIWNDILFLPFAGIDHLWQQQTQQRASWMVFTTALQNCSLK